MAEQFIMGEKKKGKVSKGVFVLGMGVTALGGWYANNIKNNYDEDLRAEGAAAFVEEQHEALETADVIERRALENVTSDISEGRILEDTINAAREGEFVVEEAVNNGVEESNIDNNIIDNSPEEEIREVVEDAPEQTVAETPVEPNEAPSLDERIEQSIESDSDFSVEDFAEEEVQVESRNRFDDALVFNLGGEFESVNDVLANFCEMENQADLARVLDTQNATVDGELIDSRFIDSETASTLPAGTEVRVDIEGLRQDNENC